MSRSVMKLWFCLAVSAISAAIADPLVEWASNAGAFGPGSYTDHSNADIVPAFALGTLFVAAHLFLRIRRALALSRNDDLLRASREALSDGPWRLLPAAFAVQMLLLYGMETLEQFAVAGHALGGTVWLGGPLWISLAAHAVACVLVAGALAQLVRAFARSAVKVVRIVLAAALRPVCGLPPRELGRAATPFFGVSFFALRCVGERAPPAHAA